jgi:Tfp pilus assembly protein FimV
MQPSHLTLLWVCGWALWGPAQAQVMAQWPTEQRPVPEARAADVPAPRPAAPAARQEVVVRHGETLDGVMRRTLGPMPFRDAFLHQAFVALNPTAFVQGSPHRLVAGARLQVPTLPDLVAQLEQQQGVTLLPPPPVVEAAASPMPPVANERSRWVRYP